MGNYIFNKTKLSIIFPDNSILSKDNRKIFKFEEQRKTYRALNSNKKEGIRLQIDGKLYSSSVEPKCDCGLLLDDGKFFLIELKGIDTSHACKQLLKTLQSLKKDYKCHNFDFFCRAVTKRGLPKGNTQEQMLIKELGNPKKFLLHENVLEEPV